MNTTEGKSKKGGPNLEPPGPRPSAPRGCRPHSKPSCDEQRQALQMLRQVFDGLDEPTGRLVDSRTGESIKVELYLIGTPVEVLYWMIGVSGLMVDGPKRVGLK